MDGFDEFRRRKKLKHEKYGNIVKLLRCEYLPDVRVVITTRPSVVKNFNQLVGVSFQQYQTMDILGFSSSSIDNYINNIFQNRPELGEMLLTYLVENNLKDALASLPLMCCAFCQLTKWTDGNDFENMNTMTLLLDKLIKCLMQYHPRSKTQTGFEKRTKFAGDIPQKGNKEAVTPKFRRKVKLINDNDMPCLDTPSVSSSDEFLLELGKVGLRGFKRSVEEELLFNETDFEGCKFEARTMIEQGYNNGILVSDTDYLPRSYEDLEIINDGRKNLDTSISFVLKIFQEKLAGMYLSHSLIDEHCKQIEQNKFFKYMNTISLDRIICLKNVFMFACGENISAARFIIQTYIDKLKPKAEDIDDLLDGDLNYKKQREVQESIEYCLQLNYESQSNGKFNDVLEPLTGTNNQLRHGEASNRRTEKNTTFA